MADPKITIVIYILFAPAPGAIVQYRSEIDGLRAIAVAAVILFHGGLWFATGGFVGVDIFFVISGYLITSIILYDLEREKFSFSLFYERRCRRLLPALFLVMLVATPVAWLSTNATEYSKSVIATLFFVSNFFFWSVTGYFGGGVDIKPLLHTWSLAVEEQFYLLFPPALLLLWTSRSRIVPILALCLIASFSVAAWAAIHRPGVAFYLLPTRAWELLAGVVCAFAMRDRIIPLNKLWREIAAACGIMMIVGAIVWFDQYTPTPGLPMLLPIAGASLVLLYGSDTLTSRILSARPLVGLGLISYSAYLWHQPVFAFLRIHGGLNTISQIAFAILGSLLLAALSWRFVEMPFRGPNISRRVLVSSLTTVGAALLSIGALGAWTDLPRQAFERNLTDHQKALRRLVEEAKATGGYAAMYSDNRCKMWSRDMDASLKAKFEHCAALYGKALLVLGDSHAMDLYNAVAMTAKHPFVVGVSQGGCRPGRVGTDCPFERLIEFATANSDQISLVLYTQSGGHFVNNNEFLEDAIRAAVSFVNRLSTIPVVWLGPQFEWRAADIENYVLSEKLNYDTQIERVDRFLAANVEPKLSRGMYVSKIGLIGFSEPVFLLDGKVTYSDVDHWSTAGERSFGARLLPALRHELSKRSFGNPALLE